MIGSWDPGVDFHQKKPKEGSFTRSPSCPHSPTVLVGRVPTKIDYRKKLVALFKPLYWRT